jgi:dihydrofolate reductase
MLQAHSSIGNLPTATIQNRIRSLAAHALADQSDGTQVSQADPSSGQGLPTTRSEILTECAIGGLVALCNHADCDIPVRFATADRELRLRLRLRDPSGSAHTDDSAGVRRSDLPYPKEGGTMGKVIAAITTSVDGYIVGPKDGPGHGLGIGGERLHYWVMGGPWTYADDGHDTDGMHGADREYFESITDGLGCGIVGRNMYDAAGAWGGTNPFPGTLIVLTHRTEDQPDPSARFLFVDGFDAALMKARDLAGDGGISLGGGADLIRQGLAAGVVDELAISTAPLVLGGGKRLFEGFEQDIDLEVVDTWSSQYATHVRYAVRRAGQEYPAH